MSNSKKRDPLKIMIWITAVLLVVAVAATLGYSAIGPYRDARLKAAQQEAEKVNAEKDQEYAAALADFQAQSADGTNQAWPTQKTEGWDVIDLTTYPLESTYTVDMSRADLMNGGMLLVNAWHSRPEDFSEEALVSIGNYAKGNIPVSDYNLKLFPVAIDALQKALTDAAAVGLTDYIVRGAYRSMDDQTALFQKQMDALSSRYSGDALVAAASKSVNYPGTSDYQSGLAFEVRLYNKNDSTVTNTKLSESAQGQWLAENGWQYGIVFRFPLTDFLVKGTADKSYKTGVSMELNLFRYVGEGNAAVMHTLGLCMEEYVEYLIAHPHIAVFENGTLKYEIYREQVGDGDNVTLTVTGKTANYSSSLDNMGGVITVFSY